MDQYGNVSYVTTEFTLKREHLLSFTPIAAKQKAVDIVMSVKVKENYFQLNATAKPPRPLY